MSVIIHDMEITTNGGNMTANGFSYDVADDTATAEFFLLMERANVGAERIARMKATREAFLVTKAGPKND